VVGSFAVGDSPAVAVALLLWVPCCAGSLAVVVTVVVVTLLLRVALLLW